MKNILKKLGTQIILLSVASLAITVAVVLTVSLLMFGSYNDNILVARSYVGMKVLENTVDERAAAITSEFYSWTDQSSFIGGITFANESYFADSWKTIRSTETEFCAVVDGRGNIIYKSDTYPFKTLDLAAVAKGTLTTSGVILQDDVLAIVHCGSITANGVSGGLVVGYSMENLEWLEEAKKLVDCDVTIFKDNIRYSTTIVDPSSGNRVVGTAMADNIANEVLKAGNRYTGKATIVGKPYYVSYEPLKDTSGKTVGAYFAGNDASEANNQFSTIILVAIIIGLAAISVTAFSVAFFTRKKVIVPIRHVTKLADEMENGQLRTTDVVYTFSDDEVGTFAEKLRHAKTALGGCIDDISGIMENMAAGDFTSHPSVDYPGDFNEIRNNILKIETDLGSAFGKMSMSSDEVLSGSDQMAEGSQALADGTTKQASAIEQISATIAEVSTQIAKTAENASKAGGLSKQTEEEVNHQDSSITNMVGAMNDISNTSKEIEKIIKTIEDISFQTNILALNAAVEAARAGDAGKGFAVVADEVRNLANKSAEAAKSTTSLITASIAAVDKGSRIASETADSMKRVKEKTAETASLIVMIADASAEQTISINQINSGIEQISQVVQMNSATAQETAASCEELSGQSRLLKDQVARFRVNN